MIKLKKSEAPDIKDAYGNCKLSSTTSDNCYRYDLAQQDYDEGLEKFEFDSSIYADKRIKNKLISDQSGKCALCEQHIISVSYGDVEHFRPKGGYAQNGRDQLHIPGYYWLAYDWANLMLVCQICNQRFKKNFFPLRNPEKRALNHNSSIKKEKPFFINPYSENPSFLIGYNMEVAYGKDRKNRGKKTIETIGLNRNGKEKNSKDLMELRADHLEKINIIYKIIKMSGSTLDEKVEAHRIIKNSMATNSQFSAMIRANFNI